jgi:hypothetical protein
VRRRACAQFANCAHKARPNWAALCVGTVTNPPLVQTCAAHVSQRPGRVSKRPSRSLGHCKAERLDSRRRRPGQALASADPSQHAQDGVVAAAALLKPRRWAAAKPWPRAVRCHFLLQHRGRGQHGRVRGAQEGSRWHGCGDACVRLVWAARRHRSRSPPAARRKCCWTRPRHVPPRAPRGRNNQPSSLVRQRHSPPRGQRFAPQGLVGDQRQAVLTPSSPVPAGGPWTWG